MGIAMYTLPVLRSHLEPVMTPLVASSHESALMATTLPSDNVMTRMHRLFSWFKTSQIGYAFGFSALLMLTGFTVIPFITLYLQHNAAMSAQTIPWLYFFGGIATFVTSPRIGQWADRAGKRYVFRYLSLAAMLPLLGVTVCADLPTWGILLLTTAFFVLVNGRMAPGMALLSAAVSPKARGRFLSLNASVQSMALGVATWLGGLLITHLPQGTLIGYWRAGLLACVSSAGCIWLLRNLPTHVSNVRNQTNES
jgi:predicted MFS family arabinose efflux permease